MTHPDYKPDPEFNYDNLPILQREDITPEQIENEYVLYWNEETGDYEVYTGKEDLPPDTYFFLNDFNWD